MFRLRIVATAIACSLLVRSVLAGGPSSGVLALSQDDKAALAQAAKNVREIIGHRGSMLDRPENTLASYRRAIEAGANVAECDVRTTRDGILVSHHDGEISRTSNGKGLVGDMTLAELRQLDFGGWFDPKFKGERIPTLQEILELCHGKIDVMLDLKESGQPYAERIAALVRKHGEPKRIVLGIRSVEHAKQFRKLLPEARQIGLGPHAGGHRGLRRRRCGDHPPLAEVAERQVPGREGAPTQEAAPPRHRQRHAGRGGAAPAVRAGIAGQRRPRPATANPGRIDREVRAWSPS